MIYVFLLTTVCTWDHCHVITKIRTFTSIIWDVNYSKDECRYRLRRQEFIQLAY